MNSDYRSLYQARSSGVSNYTVTGISNSIIAARIAFCFDLRGPTMVIDTGCSSALIAIHTASQALRTGDCDLAICGGTNFMLSPDVFVHLSKAKMVSPTGQCHAFSDKADGYTRGEGCGIVILKRLSDSQRDGDKVMATIETQTNQDGHSVTPISAPSKEQQINLLEYTYRHMTNQQLEELDYIEAHGTGTQMGDQAEAKALGEFFKLRGSKKIRLMGSIKTNIGHLESAAGVVGLIKVLLMMEHSKIVPSLFSEIPNKKIEFEKLNLSLPSKVMDWKKGQHLACVNSFGFGGSNCHAIVKSQKKETELKGSEIKPAIVCFSGKNEASLRGSLKDFLEYDNVGCLDLHDVALTSTVHRTHYTSRFATVASNLGQLISHLKAELDKPTTERRSHKVSTVFVFGGMATAWEGMCKEMMKESEIFRSALSEIDDFLGKYVSWSIVKRLQEVTPSDYDDHLFIPIAIFACQVGLASLWTSLGVKPNKIVGQSVGEVAAAYTAGLLTLQDAVKVIYTRSLLISTVTGGKMFVVRNVPIDRVKAIVGKFQGKACVSVEYSPVSCAVSSDSDIVEDIKNKLPEVGRKQEISITDLNVPAAYHSHHMNECTAKLGEMLADINPCLPSEYEMVSTVTGQRVDKPLDVNYWIDNLRQPVRFYEAVKRTYTEKYPNLFIEIGPKPIMSAHSMDIFPDGNVQMAVSMTNNGEWKQFLEGLTKTYMMGHEIQWKTLPQCGNTLAPVPRYHFMAREGFVKTEVGHITLSGVDNLRTCHPYVFKINNFEAKVIFSQMTFPSVYDHSVSNKLILPGAFYAELGFGLTKVMSTMKAAMYTVSVLFEQPFALPRDRCVEFSIDMTKSPDNGDDADFYRALVKNDGKTFVVIAVQGISRKIEPTTLNLYPIILSCPEVLEKDEIYNRLKKFGFSYGPKYSLLERARRGQNQCYVEITVPNSLADELPGTTLHPSIIDGMIQSSVILMDESAEARDLLPRSIGKLTTYRPIETNMIILCNKKGSDGRLTYYDIKLLTPGGQMIAHIENLAHVTLTSRGEVHENLYKCVWEKKVTVYPLQDITKDPKALLIVDHLPTSEPIYLQNRCFCFDSMTRPWDIFNEDFKNSVQRCDFIILLITKTTISESEDGESVLTKVHNLCMLLQRLYLNAYEQKLDKPIYLFTRNTFPKESESPTAEQVNPLMTALWGLLRCAIREQNNIDVIALDLQLSEDKIRLPFLASVAELINKDPKLRDYHEWRVTDEELLVNQIVPVDSEGDTPIFRLNHVDAFTDAVVVSSEPTVLRNSFCVYKDEELLNANIQFRELIPLKTAIQNPELFSIVSLCGDIENRKSFTDDGYLVYALETVGTLKDGSHLQKVVSCYPCPLASKLWVPIATTIDFACIPDYRLGDLTKLIVLWSIYQKVTKSSATIIASAATQNMAYALCTLLSSGEEPKMCNIDFMDDPEEVPLNDCIISLLLIEDSMIYKWKTGEHQPKEIITLEVLFQKQSKNLASLWIPSVEFHLVDTTELFSPNNVMTTVTKIKENRLTTNFILTCLHNAPSVYSEFKEITSDLNDLLEVQVHRSLPKKVRATQSELFRKDSLYLVVGGLTGLGWMTVNYLSENGAGNIALLNRRSPSEDDRKKIQELSDRQNCHVEAFSGDVTKMETLLTSFNSMKSKFEGCSLRGVFFGAAVLEDKMLLAMSSDQFKSVLSPKVKGAWNIHLLTKDMDLDYFVLYSSVTSIIGNFGQSNYGAGNAFMDGLAFYRRAKNLAGQSINWGAFDSGLLKGKQEAQMKLEAKGLLVMSEDEVVKTFLPVIMLNWAQIMPCKFDKQIILTRRSQDTPIALQYRLENWFNGSSTEKIIIPEDTLLKMRTVRDSPREQRLEVYIGYLTDLSAELLNISPGGLHRDANLSELGLDSIVTMTMLNNIREQAGCMLPPIALLSGDATV
ncbi:unnamed protein product, partial [Lymnaea stagnalis]